MLEHLVDVVLHFEGERNSRLRMVRAVKNRFGPVDEVGCFDLSGEGIVAVTDPTGLFVARHHEPVPGTCVAVTLEGRRPLLAEVQALVTPATAERPRRTTSGLDGSRVAMMVAVLQQRAGSGCTATTCSPPRSAACGSPSRPPTWPSRSRSPRPRSSATPRTDLVAIGEIGLAGELRRVRDLPQRLAEAARLGFQRRDRAGRVAPATPALVRDGRRHEGGRRPRHRRRAAGARPRLTTRRLTEPARAGRPRRAFDPTATPVRDRVP